jgi:hypothetical protein
VVAPAATIAVPVTVATAVLLDVTVTIAPPVGAGPVRVTVPAELAPADTVVGLSERAETSGAAIARVAFFELNASEAVTVAVAFAVTGVVAIGNVVEFAPAGTVTLAATVAAALLETRFTT